MTVENIITENLDIWTSAVKTKSASGRGSSKKLDLYGINKLRELILELAIRGKLVSQDFCDEPANELLDRIKQIKTDKKLGSRKTSFSSEITQSQFEIPSNWIWTQVGQIGICKTGKTPSTKNSEFFDGNIPFIGPGQISSRGLIQGAEKFLSEIGAHESTDAQPNDILMVCIGGSIGKAAIARERMTFNQQINSISPILCNSEYIFRAITAPSFASELLAKSTGSATPIINRTKWEELFLPLPPLTEQLRIANKVDELMALCDQLESQTEASIEAHQTLVKSLLETLTNAKDADELNESWQRISEHFDVLFTTEDSIDQLKQTILQLAVMGKLVKQDPNDEPASKLLERIAAEKQQLIKDKKIKKTKPLPSISESEKPFGIPNSWCWTRLGDIYSFLNGFAFKSHWFCDNGIKLLRNINIGHGETRWIEKVCIPFEMRDEFDNFELAEGDIVISLDRPIINTGLKYAIVNQSDLPCLLLQRVAKFHSIGDRVSTSFLSKWLETDTFISSINPGRSNGVPHISTKQLEMTLFPLIPENEQLEIVRKANEMLSICDSLKSKLASARSTQVKIADAMNG